MKRATVVATVLLCAVSVASQPNQAGGRKDHSAKDEFCLSVGGDHQHDSTNATDKTNNNPPKWYAALKRPEWLLLIIGLLTVVVVCWQAVEMRRATTAMRGSTQLQVVGLRQWVTLTDWECLLTQGAEVGRLDIFFKISNPTKIPLDLDMVSTCVDAGQKTDYGVVSWLVPDNPYMVSITILLTQGQRADFDASKLVIGLTCSVFYTDALSDQWEQTFRRLLTCGPRGIAVYDTGNQVRDSTPTERKNRNQESSNFAANRPRNPN